MSGRDQKIFYGNGVKEDLALDFDTQACYIMYMADWWNWYTHET